MDYSTQLRAIRRYALFTWLVLLAQMTAYLREVEYTGAATVLFTAGVFLTYSILYMVPMTLLSWGMIRLASTRAVGNLLQHQCAPSWLVYPLLVLGFSLVQVLIFADRFIFHLYGFHLNGFVWNLLLTRGGLESLGGGASTNVSFALIIAGYVGLQVLLLVLAVRKGRLNAAVDALFVRRRMVGILAGFLTVGLAEQLAYGLASLVLNTPVLNAAEAFPFYQSITFASLAKRAGFEPTDDPAPGIQQAAGRLSYPAAPVQRKPTGRLPNIVWMVAESLRADAVDPTIMPKTWSFAREAVWCRQHYSGGNGTRMGLFAMFYGLYGTYWFNFLYEHRGPVLMDTILDAQYQVKMFTSARFTYPEFDKTIFARVPEDLLVEGDAQPKWRRDRENVSQMLDFIRRRDPDRPFMTFMFFESSHANYYFTQENVVHKPYKDDLNYATMDLARDINLIKARYDNACNHLDSQCDRVFTYLREEHLLDSTIVLLAGDHGEEFMEKGHWGHNRGFAQEQVLTPLILWIPGQPPQEIDRMTSHLDIPATLMPLLGVDNPPEDYSFGRDLLGDRSREYTVVCDWSSLAYIDDGCKATFPVSGWRGRKVTTPDDSPLIDAAEVYESRQPRMIEIMKAMKRFTR